MMDINKPATVYVGLIRRMLAIFYDLLLLIATLFVATAIAFALNHGEPVEPDNPYHAFFVFYLLAIIFFYYGWFWTHGGQTLGMQTWKIKLVSNNHQNITWLQAFIRMTTALVSWLFVGLGFVWSLFSSKKQTWHDRLSDSALIDLRD